MAGLTAYALYDNDWNAVGHPSVTDREGLGRSRAFVAELVQTFFLVTAVLVSELVSQLVS